MSTPVFLSNHLGESTEKFACSVQSVVLDSTKKTAIIMQQPAFSVAGERTSASSPWVMPMWTFDYSILQSKHPDSGAMVTRSIQVGDGLRIGNNDLNYVKARVEEVVKVDYLRNYSGTTVLFASGYNNATINGPSDDTETLEYKNTPRYLNNGEYVDLTRDVVSMYGAYGGDPVNASAASIQQNNPYPNEESCSRLCFRLSEPLNLNTYIPSLPMLKDTALMNNDSLTWKPYTVDEFGVAQALENLADYPFASLVSRNAVTRQLASYSEYHEKFYWPAYVTRKLSHPKMTLNMGLTPGGYAPSRITLLKYTIHGICTTEVIVMHVAGVHGEVKSNNVHANGSFAVMPVAESTNGNKYSDRELASSACGFIANGGIISMQRSVDVRFTDLAGKEMENLSISLWFTVA